MTESLVEKFYGIVDGYYSGTRDFNLIEEALKEYEHWKHLDKEQLRSAYAAGFNYVRDNHIGDDTADENEGFEEWYNREIVNPPEGWGDHHHG